jgi:hypothetical protein
VGCKPDDVCVGLPVQVVFEQYEDIWLNAEARRAWNQDDDAVVRFDPGMSVPQIGLGDRGVNPFFSAFMSQ